MPGSAMEAFRPSHVSSSTSRLSTTQAPSTSSTAPDHSTDSCMLSVQPFVKKYAWAAVGVMIAVSGSIMLLACSQTPSKQGRRSNTGATPLRGLAAQEVQRSLTSRAILHSQGTNTDQAGNAEDEGIIASQQVRYKGKATVIVDADVCSPVPAELIIRDMNESAAMPMEVQALIDTDTLDGSDPLTIYSSLKRPVPETIRRPVSWSEPFADSEEPLCKPSNLHTPTKSEKLIPIFGPAATPDTHPLRTHLQHCPPSSSSSSLKEPLESYSKPFPLQHYWTQVKFDLFFFLSILSFVFYIVYQLHISMHKHVEVHQPVKPFPIFRLFP